jgi:hypothetical protein
MFVYTPICLWMKGNVDEEEHRDERSGIDPRTGSTGWDGGMNK